MKNIYRCLFLFLLSFLLPLTISATHIVGGVLNYIYNGSNSYTVTLTLYRDCGGADLVNSGNWDAVSEEDNTNTCDKFDLDKDVIIDFCDFAIKFFKEV